MATQSDRLRADIEATRGELANDVDRLADRTSPRRIAQRRWDGMKTSARSVKDRVMGASDGAQTSAQERVSGMAETVRGAPAAVAHKTQGSPLAVGMIAFGAGLLAAAVLPETEAERELGQKVAQHADELMQPVQEAGRELGTQMRDTVQEAASEVRETTKDAAAHTAQQARDTGQTAVEETRRSG